MPLATNPFVVLTYVSGPAILTNASALLLMSTSNRFCPGGGPSRHLARELAGPLRDARQLVIAVRRVRLIARALTSLYAAAAAFALATVTAILGAVAAALFGGSMLEIAGAAAIVLGILGFAGFIAGAIGLVLEGRLAVRAIKEETTKHFRALRAEIDQLGTFQSGVTQIAQRRAQFVVAHGLLQRLHVREAAFDGLAAVPRCERERHALPGECIGHRVHGFASEIDVEYRCVDFVFLQQRKCFETGRARSDHHAIELLEDSVHHHRDQRLVLHEENSHLSRAVRRRCLLHRHLPQGGARKLTSFGAGKRQRADEAFRRQSKFACPPIWPRAPEVII